VARYWWVQRPLCDTDRPSGVRVGLGPPSIGGAVEPGITRLLGLALACLMAIVQTAGLIAVVVGAAILLNSTGGQSPWTLFNRFELTSIGSSLVLAVLFVVLAWVLRSRLAADAVWPGSTPDPAPEPPDGRPHPSDHPTEDNEIRWEKQKAAAETFPPPRGRLGVAGRNVVDANS